MKGRREGVEEGRGEEERRIGEGEEGRGRGPD